ncbi:hypothetical protein GSI_02324 [Ganoderma sinense ZZ0214-1]|uniref:Uncharacterized protein n=1 Tax=Ganoderma sinense ZZ0214-1 TaxID=1077348 RepID=A0A2G8SPA0_9APHY|nr:hypothetical protein GSI_02324 [Ganoderma sinense ZZ0214-1]
MVSGVNPANLAKTQQMRGTTAENPIVVEDEPTLAQQPSIGKRPARLGPSDASQLPRPTSEQILGTLLQQKNIFPIVISLLRLLIPSAPSLASVSPNYPVYPCPYAATTAFQTPFTSTPSTQSRSQSPQHVPDSRQSPSFSAPPLKRRKLNSVPAGAGDWDVPYPFQDGHGPENYRTNWERERGKRLLADLVQLVQGAAQKAATKAWYQQAQQRIFWQASGRGGSGNWYGQSGMMKYYRPATFSYGLERPHAQHHVSQMYPQTFITQNSGSPPPVAASIAIRPPDATPAPVSSHPVPDLSSVVFDQLVESLLAAQQQQQQQQQPFPSADNTTAISDPRMDLDSSSQALFDNWLEILTAFPPGDPNDASGSGAGGPPTPATSTLANTAASDLSSPLDGHAFPPIPDAMIDPALLDLAPSALMGSAPRSVPQPVASTSTQVSAQHPGNSTNANESSPTTSSPTSTATKGQPPVHTPSLVGSPSVTATSLTDPGDAGPPTPSWDWTFADLGDAESAKLLDEWVGMNLDVAMASWGADGAAAVSVLETTPPATVASSAPPPPPDGDAAGQTEELVVQQVEAVPHFGSLPGPVASEMARPATGPGADPPLLGDPPRPASGTALASGPSFSPAPPSAVPSFAFTPSQQFPPHPPALLPEAAQDVLFRPVQAPANPSARAKGKAKAIPGTGNGVASLRLGKQDRRAVVESARAMRQGLAAEIERAKVALWETTLEQGVLVGLGRELEKGKGKESDSGSG